MCMLGSFNFPKGRESLGIEGVFCLLAGSMRRERERAALLRKLLSLEQAELEQTRREIAELRRAFPQLLSEPKKGHHRRQCEMTRISEIVRNGKSATAVDARVYDQLARQSNPPHWRPETVVSAVPHKMLLGGQFRKIVNS
jgi:plasmid stabilization system protein ParE